MPWDQIFIVFLVSHLAGDFILQTEFQATRKQGGLSPDRVARRALLSHGLTYTLAYVPAYVWLAGERGAGVLLVAALVSLPHIVQDDGRLLRVYNVNVKHVDPGPGFLLIAIDQSFHVVALFLVALAASS